VMQAPLIQLKKKKRLEKKVHCFKRMNKSNNFCYFKIFLYLLKLKNLQFVTEQHVI